MTMEMKTPTTRGADYALRLPDVDVWSIYPPALATLVDVDSRRENEESADYTVDNAGLATVKIEGPILRKDADIFWNDETSQETIRRGIEAAAMDPAVKQIRLLVSSPGGVASGTQELAELISLTSRKKKMYAEVDGMAASAAYWLAAATGDVRSGPSSIVGSIGVIYTHTDATGYWEQWGIKTTYITAGKYKAAGAPRKLTQTDREALQESVDHLYENFTAAVAQYMHLDLENRDEWADGRTFFGDQGAEIGLVTSLMKQKAPQTADKTRRYEMDNQIEQSTAASETPVVDVAKAVDEAVSAREQAIVEVAEAVLGTEQAGKLKTALDSGMNAKQIACAKALFGAKAEEAPKQDIQAAVDEAVKAQMSALLQGAEPAVTMKKEVVDNFDKQAREAIVKAAGNFGKEGK